MKGSETAAVYQRSVKKTTALPKKCYTFCFQVHSFQLQFCTPFKTINGFNLMNYYFFLSF